MIFAQFFGNDGAQGIIQTVISIMFIGMIFFYPKMLVSQATWKLEKDVAELQKLTDESVRALTHKMRRRPDKKFVEDTTAFLDFFAQTPVDLDPNGIITKLGKTIREQFDSFRAFVEENADTKDPVERRNLEAALINTTGGYQITKVVRHFLELVKKYKNPQIALLIQMQIPMIKEVADSVAKSVDNMLNGEPVGDGIGPLIAAELIDDAKYKKIKGTEVVYSVRNIDGRRVVVVKADGPGAVIGYPGDALVPLIKKYKPTRILTVDAAGKLEGERTGAVAEGVGVVMGPIGVVQRYEIEDIATRMHIPIDALIVKMKAEESMFNMRKEIYDAVPIAVALLKKRLTRIPKGRTLLVLGVGNTVGVGNNSRELRETEKLLRKGFKKLAQMDEKQKDKPFWKRTERSSGVSE
ncbi:MAG: DUF1512 family protein [Candidatus Aenigmarchaeota archaeon]|nr:DUF1512 family protein [Candidatus Aenigmarchaeota archaeon]